MTILGIPILSLLIFFPLLGAIVLLFMKKREFGCFQMGHLNLFPRRIHLLTAPLLCLRFEDSGDAIR